MLPKASLAQWLPSGCQTMPHSQSMHILSPCAVLNQCPTQLHGVTLPMGSLCPGLPLNIVHSSRLSSTCQLWAVFSFIFFQTQSSQH